MGIILTDVDGVLLSWVHSFEWWMKQKGYKKQPITTYCIAEQYGLKRKKANVLIEHFNESAAIGFLPPLGDAIKYVRLLHEERGYVFHCITSLGVEPYAVRLREENLKRVFGPTIFERIQCLGCGADKTEALKRYENSGFPWIEDKPENAVVGANLGLSSYLIDRPYNRDFDCDSTLRPNRHVQRIANWKELYEQYL